MTRKLLDTNVALYLLADRIEEELPEAEYFVSVVTEMELLCYPDLDEAEEAAIRRFLDDVKIVDLQADVKQQAIRLRRAHSIKLPDAIVAASALVVDAELLTNDKRLLKVTGLSVRALALRS